MNRLDSRRSFFARMAAGAAVESAAGAAVSDAECSAPPRE